MRVRHRYPWRYYIVIDKSEFRLYWYRDGRLVKTYPVAHGRVGASTPNAIWRIDSKYLSDPAGVYGPRKMRLYRQSRRADGSTSYVYSRYLIHGTNNPASIGTRASAGCIRMYSADVLELFPQVPLGTMVVTQE
ncbi:MAG: L,D-transpeptidase [Coriobacteriia bacterium]|nr:L,D-transpeptidase [Coriobacteriia bacterium]